MCEAGVNLKVMQDILGHADVEITMNIYADATKDFKRSEMLNLDEYFKSQCNYCVVRLTTTIRQSYD